MAMHPLPEQGAAREGYLISRGAAWFAMAMTVALLVIDYVDRSVISSLFPYLHTEWGLSDKQLGVLGSVVSLTVALGAVPVALVADRFSRVKSIVAMAAVWSVASISCMFTRSFGTLFAARAMVGLGEAGYGSVGAALVASHFPSRMRGALMAALFACASVGSVLGVMLGGILAKKWGWQAAFGIVGFPGLILALLYFFVKDYRTVNLTPRLDQATRSPGSVAKAIVGALTRSRTMLWVCIGAAAQLVVVSAMYIWMPTFLNRVHGLAPDAAGKQTGLVILASAVGSVVWGVVVDKVGARRPRAKMTAMAILCVIALLVLMAAFGLPSYGVALPHSAQFGLIIAGALVMTCTVGPVSAIVLDVVHPGIRSTGASVLALFQNLLGLFTGPIIAGALSDAWGIERALSLTPLFGLVAAGALLWAGRTYEDDLRRAHELDAGNAAASATTPEGAPA
jgi:MFS family permease